MKTYEASPIIQLEKERKLFHKLQMIPRGCFENRRGFFRDNSLIYSLQEEKIKQRDMVNFILIYKQKHHNFLLSLVLFVCSQQRKFNNPSTIFRFSLGVRGIWRQPGTPTITMFHPDGRTSQDQVVKMKRNRILKYGSYLTSVRRKGRGNGKRT